MNPPDAGWMPWLDKIGWPMAIMVGGAVMLFLVMRTLWAWGRPHLDRWIEWQIKMKDAESARYAALSESLIKLVDKTIEIQESIKETLDQMRERATDICKWESKNTNEESK